VDPVAVIGLVAGIAAAVLAAAGILKVVDPTATVRVLDAIGLGSTPAAARAVGVVETVLALWLLAGGGRWAAAACALVYLALTTAVIRLRRRSPSTPCGCFGQWSGPPMRRHVVVNLAGAAACAIAAATGASVDPGAGASTPLTVGWWLALIVGAVAVVVTLTGPQRPDPTRASPTPVPPHQRAGDTRT